MIPNITLYFNPMNQKRAMVKNILFYFLIFIGNK